MFTVYIHFSHYTDRSPFERERDVNFFRQYGQRTKEKKIIHGDLKFSHQLLWENMFYKM